MVQTIFYSCFLCGVEIEISHNSNILRECGDEQIYATLKKIRLEAYLEPSRTSTTKKLCEIFKNTVFTEHLQTTAFMNSKYAFGDHRKASLKG